MAVTSDVPILRARLSEGWDSMFYMNKVSVSVFEVEIGLAEKFTGVVDR
ncbi:hypothetical protein N9384_00305 [bacterium]|nr:hypothetical protein [bacterium]